MFGGAPQWHAQLPPQGVDGAAASDFDSAFASALAGAEPLPLKSVAYQPLPFSWKPAAETS